MHCKKQLRNTESEDCDMKTTKNGLSYIDISGVDCWIAYLMPFSNENRTPEIIGRFQSECIKNNVFGMGWNFERFEPKSTSDENGRYYITENEKKNYESACNGNSAAINAFKQYSNMKEGDYVVVRLKNSHYYFGKISCKAYCYNDKDDPLSWRCDVERWIEYDTQEDVASEIIGRFSQRIHPTVDRVSNYRLKLTIIASYENKSQNKSYNIPKVKINKYNFASCLDYAELEDLVFEYINNKHKNEGYKFYPSSCKINRQKYEFALIQKNKKPITCQVKNHQKINIDDYIKDSDVYEKIYLFSGEGYEKKSNVDLRKTNIVIISNDELYSMMSLYLENKKLSSFYKFDDQEDPVLDKLDLPSDYFDDKSGKRYSKKASTKVQYKKDNRFICFENNDIFYSDEYDALVINFQDKDERKFEIVDYVKNHLSYKG